MHPSPYVHVLNRIADDFRQEMSTKLKEENKIPWTVNAEVLLFYSMVGFKPVGVSRYFMMLRIHNKFSAFLKKELYSKVLWDHLDSMYDMSALHESEIIPFPNEEAEYELPEECHELLQTKLGVVLKKTNSENDTNKNSNSAKASKKLTPKVKQSSAPVNTPKNNFASPVLNKPLKSQAIVKNETKTPSNDVPAKIKSDLASPAKPSKVKRSSSPFATKLVKSESASVTKEDSSETSHNKKVKSERGSSPAILKKPIKIDPTMASNSTKKPPKSESSANGMKSVIKTETPDNPAKKIKLEKDPVSKKGKMASTAEMSAKKVKGDVNGVRKKSETDNSSKKTSDPSSVKHAKPEQKSSSQETETLPPSGSRKSSPVVKVKNSDSSKKLKRHKVEESSKKLTSTPKRRRP